MAAPPHKLGVLRAGQEDYLREVVARCAAADVYGFDTETNDVKDWAIDPSGVDRTGGGTITVGYCLSWRHDRGVYIPFGHTAGLSGLWPGQMDADTVFEITAPLLEGKLGGAMTGHNLTFDYRVCRRDGIRLAIAHDTLVAAQLISWGTGRWDPKSGAHRSLKDLTAEVLGYPAEKFVKGFHELNPFEKSVYEYAAADAANSVALLPRMLDLLKHYGITVYDIERRLIRHNAEMRSKGILVDVDLCKEKGIEGDLAAEEMRAAYLAVIREQLGRDDFEINLNSSAQLRTLFFEKPPKGLGIDPPLHLKGARTKDGTLSTNKTVLTYLAHNYPVVRYLLSYRGLTKNLGTYLHGMPDHVSPRTGRVHSELDPLATETGRYSSKNPNVQNLTKGGLRYPVPGGGEYVANVRDTVIAPPGFVLLEADFSQMEYRALAGEAGETSLLDGWKADARMDVHAKTATILFGGTIDAVQGRDRDKGKTMNFALVYGRGAAAVAEALGITVQEAEEFIADYFAKLPAIASWQARVKEQARRDGFVVTPFGRRRNLPESRSPEERVRRRGDRLAVNTRIQGGCADVTKLAIIRLSSRLEDAGLEEKIRPVLTVHDSVACEVSESYDLVAARDFIVDALRVPVAHWPELVVDCKVGYRYGTMSSFDGDVVPELTRDSSDPIADEDELLEEDEVPSVAPQPSTNLSPADAPLILIDSPLEERGAYELLQLLHAHPGPHKVAVLKDGARVVTALGTSLTPEANEWTSALGRVRVRWDADENSPLQGVRYGV